MVQRVRFGAQLRGLHSWLCCFPDFGRLFSLFVSPFPYLETGTSSKVYVPHEIIMRINCFNRYKVPRTELGM